MGVELSFELKRKLFHNFDLRVMSMVIRRDEHLTEFIRDFDYLLSEIDDIFFNALLDYGIDYVIWAINRAYHSKNLIKKLRRLLKKMNRSYFKERYNEIIMI